MLRLFSARAVATVALPLLLLTPARLEAASVTLAWDPNPEPDVAGYVLFYGTQSGVYTGSVDVGTHTKYTLLSIPEGTYYFTVVAYDADGITSNPAVEVSAVVRKRYLKTTSAPYLDRDRKTDLAVWRTATGKWDWLSSAAGFTNGAGSGLYWGVASLGDIPLSGDIDGDGLNDLIVWRAYDGTWYWLTSSSNYTGGGSKPWGNRSLGDRPMLSDMDGDGADDLVIWRASTGTWYWLTSATDYDYAGASGKQWGSAALGDVPFLADFDADGRADLTVWRPTDGTWYWLTSSSGFANASGKQWGSAPLGDVPLVGDFDGDHRSDLAIWRASTGTWYWLTSSAGYSYAGAFGIQWGNQSLGDQPLLVDMDGDGKADPAVWRASTATFFWLNSSVGYTYPSAGARAMGFGSVTDIPIVK